MRYRVEQLASACDVSVDTVRYYQSRGLLPLPSARVAWLGTAPSTSSGSRQIRSLQGKGLTLAAIRRVVSGDSARPTPTSRPPCRPPGSVGDGAADGRRTLTLETFAAWSGVPASLIQAVEREGIRIGRRVDGEDRATPPPTSS